MPGVQRTPIYYISVRHEVAKQNSPNSLYKFSSLEDFTKEIYICANRGLVSSKLCVKFHPISAKRLDIAFKCIFYFVRFRQNSKQYFSGNIQGSPVVGYITGQNMQNMGFSVFRLFGMPNCSPEYWFGYNISKKY